MATHTSVMLRRLRQKYQLTQEQVCARAKGVSRTTLAGVEAGHDFVRIETLRLIIGGMGLPRDEALEVVRCWIRDTIGEELWREFSVQVKKR